MKKNIFELFRVGKNTNRFLVLFFVSILVLTGAFLIFESENVMGQETIMCQSDQDCINYYNEDGWFCNDRSACEKIEEEDDRVVQPEYEITKLTARAVSDSTIEIDWTWACRAGECVAPQFFLYRNGTYIKTISVPSVIKVNFKDVDDGLEECTSYSYRVEMYEADIGHADKDRFPDKKLAERGPVSVSTNCPTTPEPENTLIVKSSNPNSGVTITQTDGTPTGMSGITEYSRTSRQNINVTLQAPLEVSNNRRFDSWETQGACNASINDSAREVTINISGGRTCTVTGNYNPRPREAVLQVRSSNPSSGVTITQVSGTPSPNWGGGTTVYNRESSSKIDLTLRAPAEAPNGNEFDYWEGCYISTNRFCRTVVDPGQRVTVTRWDNG